MIKNNLRTRPKSFLTPDFGRVFILALAIIFIITGSQAFAVDNSSIQKRNISQDNQTDTNQKLTIDKIDQSNFSGTAILQGLNKVTAKTSELKIKIGEQVDFGKLTIKAKKCWKSPPSQRPENKILLEITENNDDGVKKVIFYGWMFSSSPSISGLEHPIYDITAIECKN